MQTGSRDRYAHIQWVRLSIACLGIAYGTSICAQKATPHVRPLSPWAVPIPADSLPDYVRRQPTDDPVIQRIWDEGMSHSRASAYLQVLSDSLGPRLTGTPGMDRAQRWLEKTYREMGVTARREQYGTWEQWDRGAIHLDLIAPRIRSLNAMLLGWSIGTNGKTIEASVVAMPVVSTRDALDRWLPTVRGKVVLASPPRLSCRAPQQWDEYGTPESQKRVTAQQDSINMAWQTGRNLAHDSLFIKLKQFGAVAALTSRWSGYPEVSKIFGTLHQPIPIVTVGCEDYGLLARLAEHHQGPRVRLKADARSTGEHPIFNVVAEVKGHEKPNEYVILGAHFDSWDGASGTTDNGTGTVAMMEALRILRAVYPNPKRTILVGHWTGEEEGILGSRAFIEDHPDILSGVQLSLNQDDGTGRIVSLGAAAIPELAPNFLQYLSKMPAEITRWIRIEPPSPSATEGSDNWSFSCYGLPATSISSLPWDYDASTWHTNVDTYDKAVDEDLKHNAIFLATMAYLASEDANRLPSKWTKIPADKPRCGKTIRRSADYKRILL